MEDLKELLLNVCKFDEEFIYIMICKFLGEIPLYNLPMSEIVKIFHRIHSMLEKIKELNGLNSCEIAPFDSKHFKDGCPHLSARIRQEDGRMLYCDIGYSYERHTADCNNPECDTGICSGPFVEGSKQKIYFYYQRRRTEDIKYFYPQRERIKTANDILNVFREFMLED